ncbi:MAG: dipeptidase [Gammaproteobacteria bacterium]|nr:dipeptidase [Gammaproteobacteria bacterium]
MTRFIAVATLLLPFATACGPTPNSNVADPADEGVRIAKNHIIVDTHIDVPYRLQEKPADVSVALDSGDFDYPRAAAGGLNVAFMSIYTPADLEELGESFEVAESLIDMVNDLVATSPDKFAIALNPADVQQQFEAGLISLPLGMENGSPIDGDLDKLRYFYGRGIRYITLTHGKSNHISDSSYDDNKRWQGLSEFGVAVVKEMNRLGIMVDISHVSDEAFWQVIRLTDVPLIASHSSARHFTPGFERNMSDEMIKALAKNGGVIMINFGSAFLTAEAEAYSTARWAAEDEWKLDKPELSDSEVSEQHNAIWAEEHGPFPYADISDVLDHIDHVVKLVGVAHVGIGSDFDGVGDSLPVGLQDVAAYPNLVKGLLARGYSEAEIRKILGENLLRTWSAVEKHATAGS